MLNHHNIFKEQLRKIISNINKKYTVLRKQITKTSQVFDNNNIPVFPYEVCFGLFKLLSESNSVNSTLSFFPFLQSIVNLGFANEDMSRQILTLLTQLKALPKFQGYQNETKLQHLLVSLISKTTIKLSKLNFAYSIINVLFSLDNLHYKPIWTKTVSAVHQIVALCLNNYQDQPTSDNLKTIHEFINDFVMFIRLESPRWFIEMADPYSILSVLSELFDTNYVTNFKDIFCKTSKMVVDSARKLIQKLYDKPPSNNKHWQLTPSIKLTILLRLVCKFSRLFLDGFEIVEQLVKILNEKLNSYWKILAYQSIDYLFSDSAWMQSLLTSNFAELFNFLLTTQFNIIKSLLSQKDKVDLTEVYTETTKIFTNNSIDCINTELVSGMEAKMIIKNIDEIASSLYGIYKDQIRIRTQERVQEEPPLFKTYKFCHKTIFEIIKSVIPREMSEDTLQSILKTAQKFIHLSGSFQDYTTSTMFMKLLCKYCLPNEFSLIGYRHVQINKSILNTANCLGSLFNTACWVIVWKALQNYSLYYNKYLLAKEQHHSERETDVQILYKTMDSIFTQSCKYNDKYLLNIIDSLVEVTYECLENNYSQDSKKLFSFERIEQIYKLNLNRIYLIWPPLSSSLLCITTSKVPYFRISALNLLNILIPISLYYLSNHPQNIIAPFSPENYQNLILEPWNNLVKCQFQQLKNELIVAVNKVIIDYGHILTHGWKSILNVVAAMGDLKSLQSIVETFLDKVDSHIMQILLIVDSIQRKLHDTNQKYLCLTMIWAIGDDAHKHNHPQVLRKIYQILLQPDQMFSLGTEARHSSFYIFAELIVHNSLQNSPQFWGEVFQEIQNFCNYGVNRSLESKDKKVAEEAIKNILTNLVKIFRIFFMVSQQWEIRQLVFKQLNWFYRLCGIVLKLRQNQIYQCLTKQMKDILFAKTQQSLAQPQLITFLEAFTQAYFVDPDTKILKCLITYLPVDMYEIVLKCLPIVKVNFNVIYKLIEKIFLLRLEAEEKDIKLPQLRIFFEERIFNEFWKKFHHHMVSEYTSLISQYLQKLVKTLHCLLLYQDYSYLSKMLHFATTIIITYPQLQPDTLLDLLSKVMKLKYDTRWLTQHGATKDVPIWYIATQQLLKITYQFISRKSKSTCLKSYDILTKIIMNKVEDKTLLGKCSIECVCFFNENYIVECKFLVEEFFYNQQFQEVQEIGEQMLEKIGRSIESESANFDEKDPKNPSKNVLDFLFKLTHFQQRKYTPFLKKRQALFLRILLEKVEKNINICLAEDTTTQQQNLYQTSHKQQIKFILKKIELLELGEGVMQQMDKYISNKHEKIININSKVLNHPKAHLFYLGKLLSKCIKVKDQQIRNIISSIFEHQSIILLDMI